VRRPEEARGCQRRPEVAGGGRRRPAEARQEEARGGQEETRGAERRHRKEPLKLSAATIKRNSEEETPEFIPAFEIQDTAKVTYNFGHKKWEFSVHDLCKVNSEYFRDMEIL
jgi:hypothetical protein